MTEEEYKCKRTQIHLWWTVSLLTVVTVCLIVVVIAFKTLQFYYGDLMKTLGIISTLLAIILSIFSILFSYQSSVKAEGALSRLETEVVKFETTYSRLSDFISKQHHNQDDNNANKNNSAINSVGNNNPQASQS